jgi:2-polyprenyl-3-methyl-5-hydroxy-6-metoxy-1,4-benzoquinol methylase
MKRVVGRKMAANQTDDYSEQLVAPLNPDEVINPDGSHPIVAQFRFAWASGIVDKLFEEGNICYNYLDIGTFNGLMAFVIANKYYTTIDRINVDAIEANRPSFLAANSTAMIGVERGLKINIHNVLFENYKTDKTYDIISAFEILEHVKDPLFCVEKIYDLLNIGGHFMMTVPEQHGTFGLMDNNRYHYWTSTVQSVVGVLFHDDRKWRIKQIMEVDGLIHVLVQKKSYME